MSYVVYEYKPSNYATAHRADCRFVRQHGGVSKNPGDVQYHEPFDTPEEARSKLLSLNKRHTKVCSVCSPFQL